MLTYIYTYIQQLGKWIRYRKEKKRKNIQRTHTHYVLLVTIMTNVRTPTCSLHDIKEKTSVVFVNLHLLGRNFCGSVVLIDRKNFYFIRRNIFINNCYKMHQIFMKWNFFFVYLTNLVNEHNLIY
jgi:hypothetical protein